jgi:tetratricopeptide (TPR) repeat protein
MSGAQAAEEWTRLRPHDPKTFKNISNWERWPEGGHMPSLVVLDCLAQVYRCSVADLVCDFMDYGQGEGVAGDVNRREALALLGGTLAAAALPTFRGNVPPELGRYFSRQLAEHYRADMLLGPHVVLTTAEAQYGSLLGAIEVTSGAQHEELLRVATSFAALAGWLHQDAGDLAQSTAWRSETLDMAHRSGDVQLISYSLTNKAMLRAEVGDGAGAVDLARAALVESRHLVPKVRILALAQIAHGSSLTGDGRGCDRALDEIGGLIDHVDDEYPWGDAPRRTPSYLDAQRATCYGRLGRSREAVALWDGVLGTQPEDFRRDSGVYLARHAIAHLGADAPEQATQRARQAVTCLHETGSARLRRELHRLREHASPWARTNAGRDLVGVLDDVA